MSAEPHLDWIGIMLARLDNLPQRHRSGTLQQLRLTSISEPLCGAEEFPVATIRARAILHPTPATPSHRPLAYRLRKLRELQDPGSGRPALGLGIGITLAETAETPAMACPPDTARDSRAGRKGDTKIFLGRDACDSNAGIADGDTSYCVPSRVANFCCPSTGRKKSQASSPGEYHH